MVLLDSNIYIRGFNDPEFGEELRRFHRANLPRLVLSVVVLMELLVGANSPDRERLLKRGYLEPFKTRKRLHVPGLQTWETAARIDRRIRTLGGYEASLARRGFFNDILIAASARELGATVVTANRGDFAAIQRVIDLKFEGPWPQLT